MSLATFPVINTHNMEGDNPLSKRRRFAPMPMPEMIECMDNADIENHTFSSPLLLQLCGQTPSPEEIEAQLLQVGMRIRKSVHDGYQTSPRKFTPRPFFNMHRLSPETQAALCASELATTSGSALARQPISTATFCGINLSMMSHLSSAEPLPEQKMWSYTTSHKRGHEGDSDSDDQDFLPQTPSLGPDTSMAIPMDYFAIDFESMHDVSPMTHIAEPLRPQVNGRRMAKARSRRAPVVAQDGVWNPFAHMQAPIEPVPNGGHWTGHRRMTSCGMEASMAMNDFGEASFLQRRDDVDMDCS